MKIFFLTLFVFTYSALVAQHIIEAKQSTESVLLYSKITFNLKASIDFNDPYDQEDILLNAIVFTPTGDSLIIPGFYQKGDKNESEWEVRFAAREVGPFSAYLLLKNQETSLKSGRLNFSVVESGANGFLSMAESPLFFRFDSGKKFRGIGTDFGWEAKDFEDQKFTYPYYFEMLEANNGNFARSWMAPHNLPLEWNDVDNHRYIDDTLRYNTSGANKMDEVLDLAQQHGIYMMFSLDFHGELKTQPNYWGGGNFWASNVYNVANGGPCESPADFFSNPSAIKQYKNRLRYFIARWGCHTHLAVIEFWNEVDNAMADENIPPEDIVLWHTEMANYLQEIDPYDHIVSTSISHRKIDGLFDIKNIDFAQAHIYSQTTNLAETIADLKSSYNKPGVVGEFAYDWTGAPAPVNEIFYNNYFHLGLWRGLFSEAPILPLTWWWEYFMENGQFEDLNKINTFSDFLIKNSTNSLRPIVVTGDSRVEKLGLISDQNLFLWIRNKSTINISDIAIDVNNYNFTGGLYYFVYDCARGTFSDVQQINRDEGEPLVILENLTARKEIALFFTTNKDITVFSQDLKKKSTEVTVFPNPTSEYCNVTFWSEENEKLTYELFNQEGKLLQKHSHQLNMGENNFKINMPGVKNPTLFFTYSYTNTANY